MTDAAQSPKSPAKQRLPLIDELRGFAIVCMVFYHAFYDLADFFQLPIGDALLNFFAPAEPFFAALFILLSGLACNLSRSNGRRGARLLTVALALTAVTYGASALSDQLNAPISFGILHLLAVCMLLYVPLNALTKRVPAWAGVAGCALLALLTWNAELGQLGLPGLLYAGLPAWLWRAPWLFPLGFHAPSYYSADYFPLLPWGFVFAAGAFLGRVLVHDPVWPPLKASVCRLLGWPGRHSLLIYVVHQPVIYGLMWAVFATMHRG